MASGWIRAGSFQAAYSVLQSFRGGSSGSVFSRMTEWDVKATVNVENLASDTGDYRQYGKRSGKGEKTHWYSTPCNVQVGMTMVGMEQILGTFGVITQNVRDAAAKVLTESGERIKKESLDRVPVRDWDLYESWYPTDVAEGVEVNGDVFLLEIGYRGTEQTGGVPYAWRQHEEATYVHPIRTELGRTRSEWKFLEYPANDERVRMLSTAISEMKSAVAKLGGVGMAPIPLSTKPALGTISGPRLVKKPKG